MHSCLRRWSWTWDWLREELKKPERRGTFQIKGPVIGEHMAWQRAGQRPAESEPRKRGGAAGHKASEAGSSQILPSCSFCTGLWFVPKSRQKPLKGFQQEVAPLCILWWSCWLLQRKWTKRKEEWKLVAELKIQVIEDVPEVSLRLWRGKEIDISVMIWGCNSDIAVEFTMGSKGKERFQERLSSLV